MEKIGRNDPCFCGSGKKYKKCHLNIQNVKESPQDYPPIRVDNPKFVSEIRRIPIKLEFTEQTKSFEEFYRKILNIFEDKAIINALGWDKKTIKTFVKKTSIFSTQRAKEFNLLSTHPLLYSKLLADPKSIKFACSIYWNEIDQYIYQFKCNSHNLICERISRAIDYIDDHITCASIIRQVIEFVINSIANQWVITSSYNHLKRTLQDSDLKTCNGIFWGDLEDFAISLTAWSKKNIKIMSQLISCNFDILNEKNYNPLEYQPTTFQQFAIAKWVAGNFDKEKNCFDINLLSLIQEIEKLYRYLCKFIHPTPLMFPVDKGVKDYNDQDIILSVKITIINILDLCTTLYEKLSENQIFYFCRFQDLVEDKLKLSSYSQSLNIRYIENDLIKDVMNRYKGLILKTTQGDIELVKLGNFSKKTNKFAKKYEKLSSDQKDKIDKFIQNLHNAKS